MKSVGCVHDVYCRRLGAILAAALSLNEYN
jgi:hypothetical protein